MKSDKASLNNLIEETLQSKIVYQGKSFSFKSDRVSLPNGKEAQKDYVFYPEAVGIVPFINPKEIILVEQFRYPAGKSLLEIPAGKLDSPDEDRKEAAERELLEETGYKAAKMKYLCSYYSCAGYSTERLTLYKSADLTLESQSLDEDEFIKVKIVPFEKALQMIQNGTIEDSKTIIALLYSARFL